MRIIILIKILLLNMSKIFILLILCYVTTSNEIIKLIHKIAH